MAVSKNIRKSVSRTTQSKRRNLDHTVGNEQMLARQQPKSSPPTRGLNFTEVVGKIVAFVNVVNDPPECQSLELQFTDGTLLHFEFPAVCPRIEPKYMEVRRGDLELIRDYGVLSVEQERKTR